MKPKEKELLLKLKDAKEKRDALKESLKTAQGEYDKAEFDLIEFLEANSAVATAKYEGLGYAQLQKPRLYASCREESMPDLIEFLESEGRGDLVKTTVMPQTLSGFTSERIAEGLDVPEFISYYLKSSLRLYA